MTKKAHFYRPVHSICAKLLKKQANCSDLCVKAAHTAPSLPHLASLSVTPILTTLMHAQDLSVI